MKKITPLILIFICLQSCNIETEYSKEEALVQSFECMKIKEELGMISNLRNPYLMQLGEVLKKDSIPDKGLSDKIATISTEIDRTISKAKTLIENLKPMHKDTRFFDATIEYLELNIKLEAKNKLLLSSLINPNSDINIEMLLSQEVGALTQQVISAQTEFKKREFEFHNDNGIVEQEIDSIISIVKKN